MVPVFSAFVRRSSIASLALISLALTRSFSDFIGICSNATANIPETVMRSPRYAGGRIVVGISEYAAREENYKSQPCKMLSLMYWFIWVMTFCRLPLNPISFLIIE